MPAIAKEREQYFMSRMRGIRAFDRNITIEEVQQRLASTGLMLERHYIGKLIKKMYGQQARRNDTLILNRALDTFGEVMEEIVKRCRGIADDPMASREEILSALREIRAAHKDLFQLMFDAGVFERKLGTLDIAIRNTPLPEERKQAIRATFQSWGLLPVPKEDAERPNADSSS